MYDYDKYIEIVKNRLSDKRFNHSMCVAKSAKELAKKYGADEEKAYLAGILHDITKEAPDEEHMELFRKGNIELTKYEIGTKKLWHAISGSVMIKELGVDDEEIVRAIRYHTTGRENMNLLEKVLYIADFISDDRDYDGVDRMREKAKISLETAMLEGLQFTLMEIMEREKAIHPDSVAAYNELALNKQIKDKKERTE